MFGRFCLRALLLACFLLPFASCSAPSLTSIAIVPDGITALLNTCGDQQVVTNLKAIGSYTHPDHAATTQDITDQVTWYSYNPDMVAFDIAPNTGPGVATVTTCATPNVTGTFTTLVSASAPGFHGDVVGTITFGVAEPTAPTSSVRKPNAQ